MRACVRVRAGPRGRLSAKRPILAPGRPIAEHAPARIYSPGGDRVGGREGARRSKRAPKQTGVRPRRVAGGNVVLRNLEVDHGPGQEADRALRVFGCIDARALGVTRRRARTGRIRKRSRDRGQWPDSSRSAEPAGRGQGSVRVGNGCLRQRTVHDAAVADQGSERVGGPPSRKGNGGLGDDQQRRIQWRRSLDRPPLQQGLHVRRDAR